MKFYLRMEAVNLANFVLDTDDLSTVRGGGLLLRRAPRAVAERWPALVSISTGASAGIFEFDARDAEAAEELRQGVERFLREDLELKHATFVVDLCSAGTRDDFVGDREKLLARNRWRQWGQPTVAVPAQNRVVGRGACVIDKVRPATEERLGPENKPEAVSESVLVRTKFGRDQKRQDFYVEETGEEIGREFTRDFEELTSTSERALHRLSGKMGVIYLDGNKFGDKQNTHCVSVEKQQAFDDRIREFRRRFLKALVKQTCDECGDARWVSEHGRIRLEVLLWGGDELLIVVPAWKAWSTLRLFYQESRGLAFAGDTLTHKGGLVLCHHNAPIQRIRSLAEHLARHAKGDGDRNRFAYIVLESFDHVGLDVEEYLKEQYGGAEMRLGDQRRGARLDRGLGEMMPVAESELPRLRRLIPRRQLHRIAHDLIADRAQAKAHIEKLVAELKSGGYGVQELEKAFGPSDPDGNGQAPFWLHLLELWDYVGA
jgi:hypothetical protein